MSGWDREVDLLVLGSGAGGLTAALVAADAGLSTLVLEKTGWLGGTTAYSAGTSWIPGHRYQPDPAADLAAASNYLDALVGDRTPRALRQAYLNHGPAAVAELERLGIEFRHSATVVDYYPDLPGAGIGRALEPSPFDGRRLGRERFGRVRRPIPEFALFGGSLMLRRAEADRLMTLFEGSGAAAVLALRLGARWAADRLSYPRGTRLTMGNALVANLFHQLTRRDGEVWFGATTTELLTANDHRVVGVALGLDGRNLRIRARRGVVLAGGGFAASASLRAEYLPKPTPQHAPAAEGSTGDTIELARRVGAGLSEPRDDNTLWFPSSIGSRPDGSQAVFPHIWDRAKPGIIAVNGAGHRFVDESVSYHQFTRAMYACDAVPAWLILDARALARYGLGMVRPHTPPWILRRHVESGYLVRAATLDELAALTGIDVSGLHQAVRAGNQAARTGVDESFGRGQSPYGQQFGDAAHRPNVNLGPVERPPFFAIQIVPTPLATSLGLRISVDAEVLTETGTPIKGLYACGNDAASVNGSEYPGAGCQVGAALTFGYLAVAHARRSECGDSS